jgi:hypothetical protein
MAGEVEQNHTAAGQGQQTGPCPECGHALAEHADSGWGPNTVCVQKLDTFPEGGWYGVCPCVLRESA